MRIWFKEWCDNRLIKDYEVRDDSEDTRTHKIFHALEEACYHLDLSKPIWFDKTVAEFKKYGKARFQKDNFVEEIDFDYLEIHILEEDN